MNLTFAMITNVRFMFLFSGKMGTLMRIVQNKMGTLMRIVQNKMGTLMRIVSSIGDGGSGAFLRIAPKPSHPYTTFPSSGPSNGSSNSFYILCSHWKTL